MAGILARLLGRSGESESRGSSSIAKERLQFILVHDRIHLAPEKMDELKQELLAVLRKYLDVDDSVDIALQKRDSSSLLVAEVPFNKRGESFTDDGTSLRTAHDDA